MDTREDLAQYAIEAKYGPTDCNCEGGDGYSEKPFLCGLSFQLNGETHHYRDSWEKMQDSHFPECPVSIAAGERRISTLCVCAELAKANDSAEECVRCHNLAADCRCGKKAQLI